MNIIENITCKIAVAVSPYVDHKTVIKSVSTIARATGYAEATIDRFKSKS